MRTTSMLGLGRTDNPRYFAAAGLTYKMNCEVQLKGEVRQDWLDLQRQRRRLYRHHVSPDHALAEVMQICTCKYSKISRLTEHKVRCLR